MWPFDRFRRKPPAALADAMPLSAHAFELRRDRLDSDFASLATAQGRLADIEQHLARREAACRADTPNCAELRARAKLLHAFIAAMTAEG